LGRPGDHFQHRRRRSLKEFRHRAAILNDNGSGGRDLQHFFFGQNVDA